jgi:hypothetical protein
METKFHLRRHAAFCLRLSELCSDELVANQLRSQAAHYHQRAVWAEFDIGGGAAVTDTRSSRRVVRH